MLNQGQGNVSVCIEDGIAHLSFYHPKSNSLPGKVLNELKEAIENCGSNHDVKVLIIRSEGEGPFCAGASFDELLALENPEQAKSFFMGFAHVINAIRKISKFVLVRVQGKAVGGGVGLACAADYSFALECAQVKLSELAVGIGPFVVGPAVARKIGTSAFNELAINATAWRSASWAHSKGMFNEVFDSTESMDTALKHLAQTLAKSSPDAMAKLKETMWVGTEHWDELLAERAAISGRLILEDFARAIIRQFKLGG